jgi:hypothetical protein
LKWLSYKPSAFEHSCGTGFPARPCHPFPPPLDSLERLSYNPTLHSLERLSYNPPWTAWKGWLRNPRPQNTHVGRAFQPVLANLSPTPWTAWKGCPTAPTQESPEWLSYKSSDMRFFCGAPLAALSVVLFGRPPNEKFKPMWLSLGSNRKPEGLASSLQVPELS